MGEVKEEKNSAAEIMTAISVQMQMIEETSGQFACPLKI